MFRLDDGINENDVQAPSGIIFCFERREDSLFFAFPPFRIVLFFSSTV
jgi:hypothetical protein